MSVVYTESLISFSTEEMNGNSRMLSNIINPVQLFDKARKIIYPLWYNESNSFSTVIAKVHLFE